MKKLMKNVVLEFACILIAVLLTGSVYNTATGELEFFVKANRYPDARVCKRGGGTTPPASGKTEKKTGDSPPAETAMGVAPAGRGDPGEGEEESGAIPRISFDEAREAWLDGLLFVDARRLKRYEEGHVPGAVSIGAYDPGIDGKVERLAADEPVAVPVVVYCTRSDDCEDSHIVGTHLRDFGFLDVKIYEGGYPEWIEKEMSVHEGSERGPRGEVEDAGEGER